MTSDTKPEPPTFAAFDIEARHAVIFGEGPRIPPVVFNSVTPDLRMLLEHMMQITADFTPRGRDIGDILLHPESVGATQEDIAGAFERLPEIVRTMVYHGELFARTADVGGYLLTQGVLPARDRELAILRTAWLCQAPYEWGEHIIIAKQVGVTSEDIERVIAGSKAPEWSEHERALMRAAEELRHDVTISDETWAVLAQRFNEKQMIELPFLIGQYQAVACYQNALRLSLHNGNSGLNAR